MLPVFASHHSVLRSQSSVSDKMRRSIYITLTALFTIAAATKVSQCPGENVANIEDLVTLDPCGKPPCRLRKGTNQAITVKFTPEKDLSVVKNHVTAKVFGVPLPFIGVDGLSVCDKIFNEDGSKAACPLKAGNTYFYKDAFFVEKYYPTIASTTIHWALRDGKDKDEICFELPAKIV